MFHHHHHRHLQLYQILVWKEIYFGGMSEKEKEMLVAEVNLMREFVDHPNIVRYYDRVIGMATIPIGPSPHPHRTTPSPSVHHPITFGPSVHPHYSSSLPLTPCLHVADKLNKRIFIVMEYCDGGDLASAIKLMKKRKLVNCCVLGMEIEMEMVMVMVCVQGNV